MKDKLKLFFLHLGGFLFSVAPLGTVLAVNWNDYTKNVSATFKLTAGGLIVAVLILLKVLGKLKLPGSITTTTVALALSWLLAAVLEDLSVLLLAYLIGEIIDTVFFEKKAAVLREKLKMEKQADTTAERVEELLKIYVGGGRT